MSARRGLFRLAALASVVLAGGCATTVSGHGSLAAGVPTSDAHRTGGASGAPTAGSSPSRGSTPTHGDRGPGTGEICTLFSGSELARIFGGPVHTADQGDDRGCEFQTASSGGVTVNVYDFLTMKQEAARDPGGKPTTIAGHPAYRGKREILVARTSTPSAAGLIVASNLFVDDAARGNQIAAKLLERIVPKFAK